MRSALAAQPEAQEVARLVFTQFYLVKRRMTWTEARLWKELRKLDANFRRQAPIGRYFADFASHARRLVIEIMNPTRI